MKQILDVMSIRLKRDDLKQFKEVAEECKTPYTILARNLILAYMSRLNRKPMYKKVR